MPETQFPAQHQEHQPGVESQMRPRPEYEPRFKGAGKLDGKIALISGGDSGIGRAVAIAMAREGADIAILYREEHEDAAETRRAVEAEGRACVLVSGDVGSEDMCRVAVEETLRAFGGIDILVNNAGEQHEVQDLEDLTEAQLTRTFRTNIYGYIFLAKAALPHLKRGASIINTASITAYEGHKTLIDYSATKGAIVTLTRSISQRLLRDGIRVNAVAPGPIWTPLIPSSFAADKVEKFGSSTPMGRAGQPNEVAPCFVFLASEDASYISGQVLHPNGGTIVGA